MNTDGKRTQMNTDKSFCGKNAPIVVGFGRCSGEYTRKEEKIAKERKIMKK